MERDMLKDKEPTDLGWFLMRKMAAHEPPLSQSELSRRTGLSQSSISRYIYSPGRPDTDKLYQLAAGLSPTGARQNDVDQLYQELLTIAGHGRPADTAEVETRPAHRLARRIDELLGPDSPLPDAERGELERSIERWLSTFRPSPKRRRSA